MLVHQRVTIKIECNDLSHRIHGAGIFTYIDPMYVIENNPNWLVNIPAPWILRV